MSRNDIIKAALFTPNSRGWGIPIVFWGMPAVGKSDIIESIGREYGMHVEILSPGERGEAAFGVIPVPEGTGKDMVVRNPRPDWTELFDDSKGAGIVFCDEYNTADRVIQRAMLGLMHARRIGSYYLGERVRVIGAGNPIESGAGGFDINVALASRTGHADWDTPSAQEWIAHAMGMGAINTQTKPKYDAAIEEKRVLDAWPEPFAEAKGLVTAFINAKPSMLYKKPAEGDPNASRAWPNFRSWEGAIRAVASAQVHGLTDGDTDTLVGSIIGGAAMIELSSFRAQQDLPNPADVLDGRTSFRHDPARLDRTYAVLSSCAALLEPKEAAHRVPRAEKLWAIIGGVMGDASDIAVPATQSLVRAKLSEGDNKLTKAANPVLAKMRPLLDASGFSV